MSSPLSQGSTLRVFNAKAQLLMTASQARGFMLSRSGSDVGFGLTVIRQTSQARGFMLSRSGSDVGFGLTVIRQKSQARGFMLSRSGSDVGFGSVTGFIGVLHM
jgi:hypothetical protein